MPITNSAIAMDARDGRFHFRRLPQNPKDIVKSKENAVFAALQRAQPFLDANQAVLAGVDFTRARSRLDAIVTIFSAHALDQDMSIRGGKGETARQRQLRFNLRSQQMDNNPQGHARCTRVGLDVPR